MKRVLLFAILALALAATAMASGSEPVLTSDGVLYTVAPDPSNATLVLTARQNSLRESVVVPGSEDGATDSEARLAYDRATQTLYVVWRRGSETSTQLVFASLTDDGEWSAAAIIANAPGYRHSDLRVVLTRTISLQNEPVTLLHAVWWKESQYELIAEYALVALDRTEVLSTSVADLLDLTNIRSALDGAFSDDGISPKPELVPTYPPLAISAAQGGVDVVFGSRDKRSLTRVKIEPRQPKGDARLFIPGGKNGTKAPYTKIHNAMNGQVTTHISGDRVVVYAAGAQFRYATFDKNGWTPVRSIVLDGSLRPEQIARELHRTADEQR